MQSWNEKSPMLAELESAVGDLGTFSQAVSHDLRSPLKVILGAIRVLEEEHVEALGEQGKKLVEIIGRNAAGMERLIDGLLALSRVGSQRMDRILIDMNEMSTAVFEGLAPAGSGRSVDFDMTPLPPVEGDPPLVRQLLVHLFSNALKFTRNRDAALIRIGSLSRESERVFFVSDNGAGFDMQYADRLFNPFQRLHHKDEFEGTGVGLAIVQRIVNRHGGRVWAEAEAGKGATFYFTL